MQTIPLWQRMLGVAAIFAGLLLYHSPDTADHVSVLTSVAFIGGAILATRAWLATALACAFFSWLQVINYALPALLHYYFLTLAILSSAFSVYVLSDRFRARIAATRSARWANRGDPPADE